LKTLQKAALATCHTVTMIGQMLEPEQASICARAIKRSLSKQAHIALLPRIRGIQFEINQRNKIVICSVLA